VRDANAPDYGGRRLSNCGPFVRRQVKCVQAEQQAKEHPMRPNNADSGAVATPTIAAARLRLTSDDRPAAAPLTALHQHQGHRVSIVLADGTLLRDCLLVSAGRGRVQTLWIFTEDSDMFIRRSDVAAIWLATGRPRNDAA
jgi:hypothetical protein